MKITKEYLTVKVPSVFIDETRYQGYNGKQIFMFVFQNPEHHIRCFGEVVNTPIWLPPTPLIPQHTGLPAYHDHRKLLYKRASDIEMDIEVGDRVYFHYNCLLPDMNGGNLFNKQYVGEKDEIENGVEVKYHYFQVKYELVFAALRYSKVNDHCQDFAWWMEKELTPFRTTVIDDDGHHTLTDNRFIHGENVYRKEVVMIGSYVFVEPDKETWAEISIPLPETLNGRPLINGDGTIKMKPQDQWLLTKQMPQDRYLCGWVRHVGAPLKKDVCNVEVGMYVYFQPFTNTKVTFEGEELFRMRQRHIVARNPNKSRLQLAEM